MSKNKLEQVLEFLVAGQEDKAKEMLHQVFIEKARAIHEELINQDEVSEMETLGGDEGKQLRDEIMHPNHAIEELSDQIDAEEMMGEDEMGMEDAEADLDMTMAAADDEAADGDVVDDIADTMGDLDAVVADLKAEFARLQDSMDGAADEVEGAADEAEGEEEEAEGEEEEAEGEEELDETSVEEGEEEMDESFTEEDFADLAEAIELEKVSVPHSGEVGAGKFSPKDADAKSKSPTPPSQTERFGAKPVKTGAGPHASGYAMQTPPKSDKLPILPKSNQRKTENQGMENEQSGTYGAKEDSKSALDTTDKTFGKGNQTSPLTHAPRK